MTHSNQEKTQITTKKKKINKNDDQRTRKVRSFKRKSHRFTEHTQSKADQLDHSLQQLEMINSSSEKAATPLSLKAKFSSPYATSNIDPTLYLMDFSTLSNKTFEELFRKINLSPTEDHSLDGLNEFFDSEQKVTFTRQLVQLFNKLNYFQLQAAQWTFYYDLGMTEGIWCGRVSKTMAACNSMCYTYGRRKNLIEQRRKYFQQQLMQINDKLNEHLKQASHLAIADTDQLMLFANNFISREQYQLRMELERRQAMLKFDAKDHQLVELFYGLKPRQTEIHLAKLIWKAVYDEQILRYEIALLKHWFSSKTASTTSRTFQDLGFTKLNNILTYLIFDQALSSSQNETKHGMHLIDEFRRDLVEQTISTSEKIAQRYLDQIHANQEKILKNAIKFKKPPTVNTVTVAIENRRLNMVQRTNYNIEQTLKILSSEPF